MGLFGPSKKELNDATRMIVLKQLEEMASNINVNEFGMDMVRKLNDFQTQISNQPQSNSDDLIVCDVLIRRYLEDIEDDIAKGNACIADVRMGALQAAINERKKISNKSRDTIGVTSKAEKVAQRSMNKISKKKRLLKPDQVEVMINDLYSNEQLYEINLAGLQDKVNNCEKKLAELKAKPKSQSIVLQIEDASYQLQMAQHSLRKYGEAQMRDRQLQRMESFNEEQKANMSKFSEAEIEDIMNQYTTNVKTDETVDKLRNLMGQTSGNNAGFSVGSSSSSTNFGQVEEDKAVDEEKYANIQKEIQELERACQTYQNEIQKASREMNQIGNQALVLMEQRKTANNADRKTLDARINQLQSQYNTINRRIKMLEQNRIKADNELAVSRDLAANLEIQKINERVSKVSENHQSMQTKASDLREATIKNNEALDESNTAVSVATSEDINIDSANDVGLETDYESSDENPFEAFENLIRGGEAK